jgi:hypothetical protein
MEEFQAVHARHPDVGQNQVRTLLLNDAKSFKPVCGLSYDDALRAKPAKLSNYMRANPSLIISDKH